MGSNVMYIPIFYAKHAIKLSQNEQNHYLQFGSNSGVCRRSGGLLTRPERVRVAPCEPECDCAVSRAGDVGATWSSFGFCDVDSVCSGSLFKCRRLRLTSPFGVAITCDRGAFSAGFTTVPSVFISLMTTVSPGLIGDNSRARCLVS